jgi:hypothetical protein
LRLSLVAPLIATWVSLLLFLEHREMRMGRGNHEQGTNERG